MFEGFQLMRIDTGEVTLRFRLGGAGPPLLLLHGHPQTHMMWHRVAPELARELTVVAPDLRGYGESSKPPTTDDHEPYSKRAMARDMVALMRGLGHERFAVPGHDRPRTRPDRLIGDKGDSTDRCRTLPQRRGIPHTISGAPTGSRASIATSTGGATSSSGASTGSSNSAGSPSGSRSGWPTPGRWWSSPRP